MSQSEQPPKKSLGDHGHTAVRAILSAVPYAGSTASEIFNAIITPPLEKRRDAWRESIGQRLRQLEEANLLSIEGLQSNEIFITTLMQASQAAIRNHQAEKMKSLRNAVLNAALPDPPEESLQQIFIQMVDDLTVWHLRILRLFQNPRRWFAENEKQPPQFAITSSLSDVLTAAYPELSKKRKFYDLIGSELHARGLIFSNGFHTMMSTDGAYNKQTTDFGDSFLSFITEPQEKPS